jgi:transcriptional regulator with XRE-family HTH domain
MRKSIGTQNLAILCRLLRGYRRDAGLTQRQLAARLGTYQSRIVGYESGERRLDLMQLHQYAEALGVPLVELVAEYVRRTEQDREAQADKK